MRCRVIYSMKKNPIYCIIFVVCQLCFAVLIIKGYLNPFSSVIYYPSHEDWSSEIFKSEKHNRKYEIDVHRENIVSNVGRHHVTKKWIGIAVGVAVTSKGTKNVTSNNLRFRFPFFRTLLPSFCKTSTQGYSYHFYVAYDSEDSFFATESNLQMFSDTFYSFKRTMCSFVTDLKLHLVECSHNRKPAWAQNDAMMEAYLDHMDYYYRMNDDASMQSPGWTELYIKILSSLDPPFVGVVGPKHISGNMEILAFDFVHRNHIDVFGFYYPRLFTDWFADDWITSVYQPNRTVKLPQVKVLHTQILGTRYTNQFGVVQFLKQQIQKDKKTLSQYLTLSSRNSEMKQAVSGNVISFSLPDLTADYMYGVIRNLRLAKLYFPDWKVTVFVRKAIINSNDRLYEKLIKLNAEIKTVSNDSSLDGIPDAMLNCLIADCQDVSSFLIRSALGRLSSRDAESVTDWLSSGSGFHCMRDHPYHTTQAVVPGLWGGRADKMRPLLKDSIKELLSEYFRNSSSSSLYQKSESKFLSDVIWSRIKDVSHCHGTVACDQWPNTGQFPVKRNDFEYLGEKYNAFGIPENSTANSEDVLSVLKDACF